MEAELKAKYPDARVELVKGSGGIFDVVCDNRLVYSKDQSQRFPNEGEVGKLIQEGVAR